MATQLLIIGKAPPLPDPPWDAVSAAVSRVVPGSPVILYKLDGRHIRADGARHVHTIVFYRTAEGRPLVIGRHDGEERRGKAILDGDRVVVSTLEYWGTDGVEVFRTFFDNQPLEDRFALRDADLSCSAEDIRRAIADQ